MISGVKYRVLYVHEKALVLKIAIQDFLDGICPPKLLSSIIDYSLFDYSDGYETFNLVYGFPSPDQLTCSTQEVNYTDGYIQTGAIRSRAFNVSVSVTVLQASASAAKENLSALENALRQGFQVKVKVSGMELCEKCLLSNGRCGYDGASKKTICYCPHEPFNPSTGCSMSIAQKNPPASSVSSCNKRKKIAIGFAVSAGGLVLILVLSILFIRSIRQKLKLDKVLVLCDKTTENHQNVEEFVRVYKSLGPQRFTYSEVKKMTKSFSNKLGQGGYADVYKGNLPDGRLVAVKVLKSSKGNGEEFINEVASISSTSHVNIVAFLGFCYERKKRALIYEFMHNGSLDKYISPLERKLEWKTLYQIAVGTARGLEYLHRGCNIRIVHFDIKPHNILLDEDFCPKISDFGLAKQSKKESTISMFYARGTAGYIAPEVFSRNFGEVSYKSDVYSYGMMILEMVGGRENIDATASHSSEICFAESIYKHFESGKDFELYGVVAGEEKEMVRKMISVGLWCIQINPSDRPSMTKVVEELE